MSAQENLNPEAESFLPNDDPNQQHQKQMSYDDASRLETRAGDRVAAIAVITGCLLMTSLTWLVILTSAPSKLGLFAFHPTLQTLALSIFALGILTLQPTASAKTKAAGLTRHYTAMFYIAFPIIITGFLFIYSNKIIHDAPHFTSWHGFLGVCTLVWMVTQLLVGGGSVYSGGYYFGGGAKAKYWWKYHRLSGYILFPLFLLTCHLGGGYSTVMVNNSSYATRLLAFTVAPVAIGIGLLSRVRPSKMKFL